MSRAFIFTMDSILAVLVATFIAISAISLLTKVDEPLATARSMEEIGRDFLAVLEKNGTLARAASVGSSEELSGALAELPLFLCANLQLFENDMVVMQVNRAGCSCDQELVVTRRTFLARNDSLQREMLARFEGCID